MQLLVLLGSTSHDAVALVWGSKVVTGCLLGAAAVPFLDALHPADIWLSNSSSTNKAGRERMRSKIKRSGRQGAGACPRHHSPRLPLLRGPAESMETVISCPGKVLIAGGYLVLDPKHQGFVLATPSRFFTVVQSEDSTSEHRNSFNLTVNSPQFDKAIWLYTATRQGSENDWELNERDQHDGTR